MLLANAIRRLVDRPAGAHRRQLDDRAVGVPGVDGLEVVPVEDPVHREAEVEEAPLPHEQHLPVLDGEREVVRPPDAGRARLRAALVGHGENARGAADAIRVETRGTLGERRAARQAGGGPQRQLPEPEHARIEIGRTLGVPAHEPNVVQAEERHASSVSARRRRR